jgi:hypothetical protein
MVDDAPEEHIPLTAICRNRECPAKRRSENFRPTSIILASWRARYSEYRCLWCDGKVETIETEEEVRGTPL